MYDCLAKGLAELGHTVYYNAAEGYSAPLPQGIIASREVIPDADIYHMMEYPCGGPPPPPGKPWLRTVHCPYTDAYAGLVCEQLVFVSHAQAGSFGSERYVWNGVDPAELIFSASKEDYFLFMVSRLSRASEKGLETAISVAERVGARLFVAAQVDVDPFPRRLMSPNVTYVGEVAGEQKAVLMAGARALLFPGHPRESFGLVVAEALMSGTPVITGRGGGLPEVARPEVGFTCDTLEEYVAAAERVDQIDPAACRQLANAEFHYEVMAHRYVAEYEKEMRNRS